MALKPTKAARIEQLLRVWQADNPAFFWAPTRPENFLKDQQRGLIGRVTPGLGVTYGGLQNTIKNGPGYVEFPSNFGLGANSEFFCMLLVDIVDPQAVTGCFLKFGGTDVAGCGVGGGDTTFENTGSKLIALRESLAWVPGTNNSFVSGLNVISFFRTSESAFGATNVTTASDASTGLASYNAPSAQTTINGQGTIRGSNATVCAVAIWPVAYNNATTVLRREALAAPLLGLARQNRKPWFTPRYLLTGDSTTPNTAALTGNQSTSARGIVVPSLSLATTGNQVTASVGTLTASTAINVAITGNAATTAVGIAVPSISLPVTGVQATASSGVVSPDGSVTLALTGNAATSAVGALTLGITVPITGVQATASSGLVTPPGNVSAALTGVGTTASVGTLTAALSLGITGVAATSAAGTVTPASGNVVALTGNGATSAVGIFTHGISLALTGRSATASIGSLGVGGWQQIDDSQTPNWVQIVGAQTPNWTPI